MEKAKKILKSQLGNLEFFEEELARLHEINPIEIWGHDGREFYQEVERKLERKINNAKDMIELIQDYIKIKEGME